MHGRWATLATLVTLGLVTTVRAGDPADARYQDEGDARKGLWVLFPPPPAFWDLPGGARPTRGEGTPAPGHPHYDLPSKHYGVWYRPTSFGRGPGERCAPEPFNPRGWGNLFARSSTPHRMDYHPEVQRSTVSRYGPSYLARPVPYNCCPQCGLCGGCAHGCFGCCAKEGDGDEACSCRKCRERRHGGRGTDCGPDGCGD